MGLLALVDVSSTGIQEGFWPIPGFPQDTQKEGFSYQEALKMLGLSGAKSDYLMAWKSMDFFKEWMVAFNFITL